MQAQAQLAQTRCQGNACGLDLGSVHDQLCLAGLTLNYLQAWSSWACFNLRGKGGQGSPASKKDPCSEGSPQAWTLRLGSHLATPWEEPRPLLDPGAPSAGCQGFPSLGWGKRRLRGLLPGAVSGCGVMATFQSRCRPLATADFQTWPDRRRGWAFSMAKSAKGTKASGPCS